MIVQPREQGQNVNLVRRVHLRADCHCDEGTSTQHLAVHMAAYLVDQNIRQNHDLKLGHRLQVGTSGLPSGAERVIPRRCIKAASALVSGLPVVSSFSP